MPKKKIPDEEKLKPLRIFAEEGPYGLTYLSILVQRKKLKAKKVGRNYYTTKIWFDAYMNKHARENKKAAPVMTDMNPVASVSVSDEDMVSKGLWSSIRQKINKLNFWSGKPMDAVSEAAEPTE